MFYLYDLIDNRMRVSRFNHVFYAGNIGILRKLIEFLGLTHKLRALKLVLI